MQNVLLRETSANRSVERTLHLLLAMEEAGRLMGLTELSRATHLPKATVQRLLNVLEQYGFAEKWQGKYHIGIAILPLANAFLISKELIRIALPVLQELAQTSEETASLSSRFGFHRIIVLRIEGLHPLRYVMPIGQRLPLHVGMGKIFASAMSGKELQEMLDQIGDVQHATGETITRESFLCQLEQIRRQGYVISRNERMIGASSVSAPVLDANGNTFAAVSVSGNADRLTLEILENLSIEVRAAARAIAERYHPG